MLVQESTSDIYIGRQPILDQNNTIQAFELLFRSGHSVDANVFNVAHASLDVILKTLSDFGLKEIVGKGQKAYFNVNKAVLMSDMIELVPKEQVVIELLESIEVDSALVNRCLELKKMGYRLALDDFTYKPTYEPLFEAVDVVKVDLLKVSPESLETMITPLKRWPLTLLAEKVEDAYQFERTRALGFELFQGYYFARPAIITGKRADPSTVSVMKLLDNVLRDAELSHIEQTFKESPPLSFNLLRLVNSVALGMRQQIESIRHAVVLLGRDQLKRWAQILLFTHGDSNAQASPLLQTAAMRGRFMELLVEKGACGGGVRLKELAFMIGILSLIDALLVRSMDEILSELSLADEISMALLKREGPLGKLLVLVERLECADFDAVETLLDHSGVSVSQLYDSEQTAAAWTKSLMDAF